MKRRQQFKIKLSPRRSLVVSLRRFRTAPARRSKKYSQLVIQTGSPGIKEISLRLTRSGRRKQTRFWLSLKSQALPTGLILFGLIGLIVFGSQIAFAKSIEPTAYPVKTIVAAPVQLALALPRSVPVNLSIPSISITADIISVGQTESGEIAMPPLGETTTVGWYEYGPTPGELGPAVIVGHLDNYVTTSVFYKLHLVAPGAKIVITRADGKTASFQVTQVLEADQANFPTSEVYGNIDFAGLRLITCGGRYDSPTGSYTENTIVFAKLID